MTDFYEAASELLADHPKGAAIAKTFAVLHAFVEENDWQGACHATTAVAFVLLGAQNIEAVPCLGEVMAGPAAWDHSWVEIDGAIFDVAIARPLVQEARRAPVIAGCDLDRRQPTDVAYGVVSGIPPLPAATMIARMPIGAYMDGFPAHADGLWGIVSELAHMLEMRVNLRDLRARYRNTQWSLRPPTAAPSDRERRVERNRRKRERQGR